MENKLLGSCPHCGGNIWSVDEQQTNLFWCIRCKIAIYIKEIIPF